MIKFLTINFWFESRPELTTFFVDGLFGVSLFFLLIAAFSYYNQKEKTKLRKFWMRLEFYSGFNFIMILLWWFFALEGIPLLTTRFLFFIFGLIDVVWFSSLVIMFNKLRKNRLLTALDRVKNKYIP
ncbi:MAG: hypothetical protein WCG01_00540 [bacterium]